MSERLLTTALLGAVAATTTRGGHVLPAATWRPGPRRAWFAALAGIGTPGHVALTFDDGPDPDSTPLFLDAMAALGVRGTFFLVGESASRHPQLTRQIADQGHELAVHGWRHDWPWRPAARGEVRDLRRAAAVIADLTGTAPHWYRPPYGILTGGRYLAAARAGLRPVLWSAWGRDWARGATAGSVRSRVALNLRSGGTVLLHDADRSGRGHWRPVLAALPGLVALWRAAGWTAGPLGEHWS